MPSRSEQYLVSWHARRPGATSQMLTGSDAGDGRTSYQVLADVLPRPLEVLDLGCGDGVLAEELLAREHRVTGIDLSEEEIRAARARLGNRVHLLKGRAQNMPFARARFDAIVSHLALMLMDDVHDVLSEARRVLAPHGYFAFIVGRAADPPPQMVALFRFWHELREGRSITFPPPLGDLAWSTREGIAELFSDWADLVLSEVDVHVEVPWKNARIFLEQAYYGNAALFEAAGSAMDDWLKEHRPPDKVLRWTFPLRLGVARRGADL